MPTCQVCDSKCVKRGTKNGYDLYTCASCALMFVHPLPDPKHVYDKSYFEGAGQGFGYVNYDEDKEPMVPTFQKYLQKIRKELGGTGKLLDVGAATGFFVELAQKDGFKAEGVEISDHAASLGREKGRNVKTGILSDVEGEFDCITMLDVIEHVLDPKKELASAAARLRRGGILIVNTPDSGSLVARMLGLKWHHVGPPEHLYYFNRKNFQTLLEKTGFIPVEETTIGKSFTIKYILKTLNRATGLSLFAHIAKLFTHSPLSRLSLPLNLYDNMFIVARKK